MQANYSSLRRFFFSFKIGKKDGKKIRKNSICDWYFSSFFFYPYHFPREFPSCFATLFRTRIHIHLERPNKKKKKGTLEFFSRPLNSQTSFQVYYFGIIISRGKDLDTNPRICNYRTLSCPLRKNVTLEK